MRSLFKAFCYIEAIKSCLLPEHPIYVVLLLKMISSSFCAVSVLNVCEPHTKECESMLFVNKYVPYLRDLSNSLSNSFIDFYNCEAVS